jgi:ATP-binding cassette, subfamily C, bacterial LapB
VNALFSHPSTPQALDGVAPDNPLPLGEAADAVATAPEEPVAPDLLMLYLERLAVHFGRTTSPIVMTAGLPLAEDGLSTDLFIRAAERVGLRSTWRHGASDEITSADLPAIAWQKDGMPVIVEARHDDRSFTLFRPDRADTTRLSAGDASVLLSSDMITVAPNLAPPESAEHAGHTPKHWLWAAASLFWHSYAYIILATVFINVLALASPLFTMNIYDRVLPNKALSTLWVLATGVVIAFLFDFLLRLARASLIDQVSRRLDLKLSSTLIERVLNTRLSGRNVTTGVMTQRLNEYEFVREFMTSNTTVFFIDLVFSVLFLIVIAYISPLMVLAPLFAIGVMVGVGILVQRAIGAALLQTSYTTAHRQSLLVEILGNLETVKSLRGEGSLLRRWDTITREASNANERIKSYSSFATNFAYFIQMMVTVLTVMLGAYLFDSAGITAGGIIAVTMLASRAVSPMGQIAMTLARMRQAFNSLKTLDTIMALPDERDDRRLLVTRSVQTGHVEFRDAVFAYQENARPVLNGLNLKIAPGERVAVLGKVGAGKTTLGRLLVRLYELVKGEILIDGVDIRHYHPHEIRRAINFIGQESDLFHGTLRENLLLARPNATDEELLRAAKLAGVDEFIASNPAGYEMQVGERGAALSSGQRQMVGLARAFLSGGKVLFLDDPTSSMDMATERLFVARLKASLTPGMTMIVTTHRHAMLSLVDRVIVVDSGRVVADGPTDVVLRRLADNNPQAANRAPAAA